MTTDREKRRPTVRALVAAATAWVTVVALGSTLVWAVISRAGEGVVSSHVPDAAQGAPTSPTQERSLGAATSVGPPQSPASSVPSATATASPGSPTSSAAPVEPVESPSEHDTHPSQHSSGPSSPPPASSHQATWSGRGGSVTAECTGPQIRRVGIVVDSGYRVEMEQNGPVELRVHFERTGEQEGETEVTGVCRGGVPQLTRQYSGEDD